MGRRKASSKKVIKKKKPKLATVFKCPFCSHDNVVECTMDNERGIGTLLCRICAEQYQSEINYLTEPIDLFSEWVDEIVDATAEAQEGKVDE